VYECKVSVIEGEAITSMGIETGMKIVIERNAELEKNERVKDNKSDANLSDKKVIGWTKQ
jgi:hypothetical protein